MIFLLTGLLIVVVIILGVFIGPKVVLQKQSSQTAVNKPTPAPSIFVTKLTFENDDPGSITNSVYDYFKNRFEAIQQTKDNFLWWTSDDGWNISINDPFVSEIYFKQTPNNICNGPATVYGPKSCVSMPQIIAANKLLSDAFISEGFVKNALNSSKSLSDTKGFRPFGGYLAAFQKNDTRCLIIVNDDRGGQGEKHTNDAMLTVECSDNFQKAYQDELPYLKALKEAKVLDPIVMLDWRKKQYGDFVLVAVDSAEAVMKKIGDGYKFLFATQQQYDQNQCAILKQNGAPQEMLRDCN